jgi:hypothetical protein
MSGRLFGSDGGAVAGRADPVLVTELSVAVYDRGPEPEYHRDRSLFGPWRRYEAELASYPLVREVGATPWEAVYRLVSNHRPVLERRWSSGGGGDVIGACCPIRNNPQMGCFWVVTGSGGSVWGCCNRRDRRRCSTAAGEVRLWATCGLVGL